MNEAPEYKLSAIPTTPAAFMGAVDEEAHRPQQQGEHQCQPHDVRREPGASENRDYQDKRYKSDHLATSIPVFDRV
jgi:hypothetical protein